MSLEEGVVASNLAGVQERIEKTSKLTSDQTVRLIAVSKTKPNELLQEAYDAGQRYFGENYVQELCGKVSELPTDIQWHFIGPLQSNKANLLVKTVGLDQLSCVETVASLKLAKKLNKAVVDLDTSKCLGIYIQINTSGEESKSGVLPGEEMKDLTKSIMEDCPQLKIKGVMTIGAPGKYECFDCLVECRQDLADIVGVSPKDLDLSMGMSGDFEEAIQRGATNVRVGSTIFGARDYSNK